jgi:hypothetical protein
MNLLLAESVQIPLAQKVLALPGRRFNHRATLVQRKEKKIKAGAELCQAQDKLGLAKPALPIKKLGLSPYIQI